MPHDNNTDSVPWHITILSNWYRTSLRMEGHGACPVTIIRILSVTHRYLEQKTVSTSGAERSYGTCSVTTLYWAPCTQVVLEEGWKAIEPVPWQHYIKPHPGSTSRRVESYWPVCPLTTLYWAPHRQAMEPVPWQHYNEQPSASSILSSGKLWNLSLDNTILNTS